MTKKALPVDVVMDDLAGSPFFKRRPEPISSPTGRPPGEPVARRNDRPTGRRVPVRRGFEFYEDQLMALKKLSLEEQMDGQSGNMSQMVREALDDYLAKRTTRRS
jgi:hypothetical protein